MTVGDKYRFIPINDDIRTELLNLRSELDCIDEDEIDFAEPPYEDDDSLMKLAKLELPHDPHRSPERNLDVTVSALIELARTHPDADVDVDSRDVDRIKRVL